MASRTLPGLGLNGFWELGESGWKPGTDANWLALSVLAQCAPLSRTTALPGAPTDGMVYIVVASDPTNPNKVAVRDNGAWVYLTPFEGLIAYIKDTDKIAIFNGTAWADYVSGGSTLIAIVAKTASATLELADASSYVRLTSGTPVNLTVPPNADVAFPIGTTVNLRQSGAGQVTVVAGAGVTVNTSETLKLRKQGSTASLIKIATNEWDLTGDLEVVA